MINFVACAYVALVAAAVIGWALNLFKVIGMIAQHAPLDALFIGRMVGVPVAIIGAILGWF